MGPRGLDILDFLDILEDARRLCRDSRHSLLADSGELFLAVLPLLFHYKLAACLDVYACGELLDVCAAVAAADVVDRGGGRFS